MCKDEKFAKRFAELFVMHMEPNQPFVVRNNIMVVLGDLCVTYTSLVDRHENFLTDTLRDSKSILRKQ